jgi:hypothetical protein
MDRFCHYADGNYCDLVAVMALDREACLDVEAGCFSASDAGLKVLFGWIALYGFMS